MVAHAWWRLRRCGSSRVGPAWSFFVIIIIIISIIIISIIIIIIQTYVSVIYNGLTRVVAFAALRQQQVGAGGAPGLAAAALSSRCHRDMYD